MPARKGKRDSFGHAVGGVESSNTRALSLLPLSPSPRPLPQLGGEGKGEGELSSAKGFLAFVLVVMGGFARFS
jgi:hypothetical protein